MNIKPLPLRQSLLCTIGILLGIGLDQLTKWLCVRFLVPVGSVPLWQDVLHLTYVENRGAAFGMLAEHRWVFLVASAVLLAVMIPYLYLGLCDDRLATVGVCLIIAGGIGNMIDRLALGYVIDFIDVRLINFAVFNGADSFVCVGAGLLVLSLLRSLIRESKKTKNNNHNNDNKTGA